MGSRATEGGLSADNQLPGLPNIHYEVLNDLIHPDTSLLASPIPITQQGLIALLIRQSCPLCSLLTSSLAQQIAEMPPQRVVHSVALKLVLK